MSTEEIIPIGLPQGTQLSVCLFLLYINEIVNVVTHGKVYLFADDTVLVITNDSLDVKKLKRPLQIQIMISAI